jgi:uncharacterized membrane protein (UPF0127 family)
MNAPTLRILNHSKNSVLTTCATIASTPAARIRGLIGVTGPEFQPGAGLFFNECNAIHTVQMSMRIDVLFIDMLKRRVQKAVQHAEPWCHFNALIPVQLCSVLELPAGVIELTGTEPGDVIVIMSSGHSSEEELKGISSLWPTGA